MNFRIPKLYGLSEANSWQHTYPAAACVVCVYLCVSKKDARTATEGAPSTDRTTFTTSEIHSFIDIDSRNVYTQHEYAFSTYHHATPTTEVLTTLEEETTFKATTIRHISTPKITTPLRGVTEGIEYHDNFAPYIENRLQQVSVIAGKIFRFVIPLNAFKDIEDEYNLTYELLDSDNKTVKNNTWLSFNPARREIYGLPLEDDVSKWVFWIKATDQEGSSTQERLIIHVQQHKLDLVVNHEISLYIRIEKHQEFPHYVDWSLRVLRALGRMYHTNMTEITVRHINYTSEPVIFTWSNDSIPTVYCPDVEIEKLYKTLTANDRGDPARELNFALAPELRVKKVVYRELGVCQESQTPATPSKGPVTPPGNFSPILRNPIDEINATVGELLIYTVKEVSVLVIQKRVDTFYDPEDVDPMKLNISLLTGARKPIPAKNWLQFDSKNREFFGIPRKVGRSEYQLICVDSGGQMVGDSLEVVVHPPQKKKYNVEFIMNITEYSIRNFQ
ncbi:hypothetical protein NQ317_009715 [Molorchus minor]|uniref:Dystroglycan 1 n=1 Tax=Molorchus minor TaxID=1323400 RepID=A0ABQ9JEJ7_9CUCU|nr:hypothetical protein NQ317_009715 [Molorchus minor]